MAGYRPKSLDELNSIFDKTMAAEKAIKKGSSLLEKGEDSFSSFSAQLTEEKETASVDEEKTSEEITDSVNDFIARFTVQSEKEQVRAKPQMTVLSAEAVKKEYEIENDIFSEEDTSVKEAEKPSRDELMDEYMKIMSDEDDEAPEKKKLSRKEKKKLRKKDKAPQAEEVPQEPEKVEEIPFESMDEAVYSEPEAPADEEQAQQENVQQENVQQDESGDFDFPENYTPEWIKDEEEKETEESEVTAEKPKVGKKLLKVFLSLILVAVISVGALATVFKTVVSVNTGKLVADKYYVFTTYKDYSDISLPEGELVVTEKKYAEDGEVFAYVDYANKSFEFGRRIDSITKEDGEVLYVTEKDGGRTLVSRDDCKGVVYLTYSGRGAAVSFLTDNYIIVIAAAAVISLIIVLLFVLVLRTKKEEKYSKENEELSEETEDEFEDIFSTIE